MTDEAWKALAIIVPSVTTIIFGYLYRRWSSREHKQTSNDVTEIKLSINGDLQKKLEEAREEGRREEALKRRSL